MLRAVKIRPRYFLIGFAFMNRLLITMQLILTRLQALGAAVWLGVRHPTRRGVALSIAGLPALLLLYVLVLIPFTPSIGDIRKAKEQQPAVVMSVDGQELAVFKRANREWVKLADISPQVIDALISTEDHRFYSHHGLDVTRTVGAVLHTLSGSPQGGSTITQQLARNLYPDQVGRAQTLTRKLKELITSLKIESVYSKDEILETYLNTVPFLYNAYGIEMAARTYFDKSAEKLDVLESAMLIGMLKGTSYYNPVQNPDRALQRRNLVLSQMVKHQKLDADKLAALQKKPLRIDFERQTESLGPAPHVTQYLRRWLIEWADQNDYNIYADGLVVHTTIDGRLQKIANQAVARQGTALQGVANSLWTKRMWQGKPELLKALVRETAEYKAAREAGLDDSQAQKQVQADAAVMQPLLQDRTRVQAGFLAMEPSSGHILAWVGSRDYRLDPYDHVQQARRQPGSTFKPFVYGAAFAQGASPNDTLMDSAVAIPLGGGAMWRPRDGRAPSDQPMTLRDGLAYSKNTITAQVMQSVGPTRVAALARAMGVRQSTLEEVPSLALGTSPVTLKEMVSAYSTLANTGSFIEPLLVTRVENRKGEVLASFESPKAEQALPEAAANTLLDAMRGVIDRGTGAAIRSRYGIDADVAGKTGTTQDNTDGWFILMHPQMVAGAWVGFNDNRVTLNDYWGQGAHSALPIVGEFFQQSLRTRRIDVAQRFAAPQTMAREAPPEEVPSDWFDNLFPSNDPPAAPGDAPGTTPDAPLPSGSDFGGAPSLPSPPAPSTPPSPPSPTLGLPSDPSPLPASMEPSSR